MKDPQAATERVGRYQLLEPIGSGPNGVVSRAKVFGVAGFERQFAVKRFSPELTSVAAAAQSLSSAARQYGSLEHPRIARMAEFGVAQGQTYTAVELVAGLDAMRLMAETKLAGATLATGGGLALVSQAARAVGYAHGRGLSHLGLAPTNLIVTIDGDVKVTDFGILAATLPPKPVEAARIANRIPYLAPEQLAGEATSAASDVFVLGVIAYELVTGQRAFKGDSAQQVARAILSGPPQDPPLPRPIVRVLQRCLARSPFERFPDARALADALDAALRVAPVPGTRKDIGAQVKHILDRLSTLNENQLSGMVALNLGTGPITDGPPSGTVPTLGRDSHEAMETAEYVRAADLDADVAVPPAPPVRNTPLPSLLQRQAGDSPLATKPDMPKIPITTVPGLAPPPIPVPPGIAPPPTPPTPPLPPSSTMLGVAAAKKPVGVPAIPPMLPRTSNGPSFPPVPMADPHDEPTRVGQEVPQIANEMMSRQSDDDLLVALEVDDAQERETLKGTDALAHATFAAHDPHSRATSQGAALEDPHVSETLRGDELEAFNDRQATATYEDAALRARDVTDVSYQDRNSTLTGHEPARQPPPRGNTARDADPTNEVPPEQWRSQMPQRAGSQPTPAHQAVVKTASMKSPGHPGKPKWLVPVLAGITLVVIGVVGWQIWVRTKGDDSTTQQGSNTKVAVGSNAHSQGSNASGSNAGGSNAAGSNKQGSDSHGSNSGGSDSHGSNSGSNVAVAAIDAGVATTAIDAAAPAVDAAAVIPTPSDQLQIVSTPKGARVFIDGADQGTTPVKLAGSTDRHTVALLLPGHELYVAEVDGHGVFQITMKPVTPPGGPAGIKVTKCKDKARYYVFVDGAPTGMTCPTERIETTLGPHVVEVYDIVTETRRKFEIKVESTRLSYRVRIE